MKHPLIANGTKESITVKIDGEQYATFRQMTASGVPAWKAAAQILGVDESTDFVINQAGTSSRTQDGLFVKFF